MSVIVGILKESGSEATEIEVQRLLAPNQRFVTGPGVVYVRERIGMAVQPYTTHERSALDGKPIADSYRNALSFDGRLDNYRELAASLGFDPRHSSDSMIVLAAFRRWGDKCFSRLCGDWALALWCEREQTLRLARDHAGARTLYFSRQNGFICWSTYLDTFTHSDTGLSLSKEYLAQYLAGSMIRDLTPYEGIRLVRSAHCHVIRAGAEFVHVHWSPSTAITVRYKDDAEYDEHFRNLFLQAVERRTGTGAPVLAELSGGMDSTAIVCASDLLRRKSDPQAALIDTVSYYDDGEASLDERRYFTITEARRGKAGMHLEMASSDRTFAPHDASEGAYATPGADSLSIVRERRFEEGVWKGGYRSILSGAGGDELLGGVPDGLPELSGYLVGGQFGRLLTQAIAWSLIDRYPLIETVARTFRHTAEIYGGSSFKGPVPAWLARALREMVGQAADVSSDFVSRWKRTPRQLENERSWWAVLETLPHLFARLLARPEYRYPYLDKDLVDFLHSVPSDQLVRPGRRRFLMRRALIGIVPEEILERRRKAFQSRGPLVALQQSQKKLEALFNRSISAESGFIDINPFMSALRRCCAGDATEWQAVLRTIALELWLQSTLNSQKQPDCIPREDLVA